MVHVFTLIFTLIPIIISLFLYILLSLNEFLKDPNAIIMISSPSVIFFFLFPASKTDIVISVASDKIE